MIQLAFSDDFLSSMINLPKNQQKKVNLFVSKFRTNSQSSGINYEKINDAANPHMRSVRIDQTYRGIILKPQKGQTFILLWVDHHDNAYAWARNHQCKINANTGAIQLYESQKRTVNSKEVALSEDAINVESTLFSGFNEEQFAKIGLPPEYNNQIFTLNTEKQLEILG